MKRLILVTGLALLLAMPGAFAQVQPDPAAKPAAAAAKPDMAPGALARAAQERAQQQQKEQTFDPRLALPTINALQGMLALREKELAALTEDAKAALAKDKADSEAREATLIEWLKTAQGAAVAPAPPAKAPVGAVAAPPATAHPAPAPNSQVVDPKGVVIGRTPK